MIEIDRIYNEDCLEGMKRIDDGSVDCIITDLPYGTTDCPWDSIIPFEPLWEQYRRITKPNAAIVLFGSEPFSTLLRMSNLKAFKYDWIWNKEASGSGMLANIQPLKIHEIISVFGYGSTTYNPIMTKGILRNKKSYGSRKGSTTGYKAESKDNYNDMYYPKSIVTFSNASQEKKVHPTQKPVDLLRYLILTYSNEGDTILDATIGSGTTAVAALMEKRHFIGFETNKEYFDIAQGRIDQVLRNPTLF